MLRARRCVVDVAHQPTADQASARPHACSVERVQGSWLVNGRLCGWLCVNSSGCQAGVVVGVEHQPTALGKRLLRMCARAGRGDVCKNSGCGLVWYSML